MQSYTHLHCNHVFKNIAYFTILLKTANRFSTITKIIRAYPFFWSAATKNKQDIMRKIEMQWRKKREDVRARL